MNSINSITKILALSFVVQITLALNGYSQIQKGSNIYGEHPEDQFGIGLSMPDAETVAVGAMYNSDSFTWAGSVRVFTWNGSTWVQKGSDLDGEGIYDQSGWSISMPSANTIAIGANKNDGNGGGAGHVRIYEWNGNSWIQKGVDIDGEAVNDYSGWAVSMPDNNTVGIGAYRNDDNGNNAGHARVYEWNGSAWIQKGMDLDGEAADDWSGMSVTMPDANTIAIGAPYNNGSISHAGHVRIYEWNGSAWIQKGLDIDGEGFGDESGRSKTISMPDANTIAIGASANNGGGNNRGHVRIFTWNGSAWIQKGIDIDGKEDNEHSGYSVSMSDSNNIAIGAYGNDVNGPESGKTRIYTWNGLSWVQVGIDIDGEAGDWLGQTVSMPDPYTVGMGARFNQDMGFEAGKAVVYTLKGVQGFVFNDINQNCVQDELGLVEGMLGIIEPGGIIVETNSKGMWSTDSLPVGNYTIKFDTTGNWKTNCPNLISFSVSNPNTITIVPNFGMFNLFPCPEPNISVNMPFIRPGFSNQKIYVQACNDILATGAINNASLIISIDELLTLDTASLSYNSLGNNSFSFDIGDLSPGECVDFTLSTTLSSTASLGRTICMEAELVPVDSCALDTIPAAIPPDFTPCSLPWDKSSISVEGECLNDSVIFTITNTGDPGGGDMDCYSPVRLYIDGVYIWLDSIQLNGGDSSIYSFAGDGQTWHLEVDQHPLHPGNSNPNATVELCGNSANWTPDLVNIFPHDDYDPINDIYCGIVTGSYDPNDKSGLPIGVGPDHLVAPNGKIDYTVRFQNTGTDTAFTVVIRDTLDIDLDIFSVQSGVSSHSYTFQIYGPRVLEWTFDNILLPDSTTNEPESNGFVTFSVNQEPNLPNGTEINNTADIYFDFNPPIITNTTSHKIGIDFETASWIVEDSISNSSCDSIMYNGVTYTQSGNYFQVVDGTPSDTLVTLDLVIAYSTFDTDIQSVCDSLIWIDGVTYTSSNNTATYILTNSEGCDSIIELDLTINNEDMTTSLSGITISSNNPNASYAWLDCDSNFVQILGETSQSFTPTQNGSYAVELTENGCVDTTNCVAIMNIGILENNLTNNFVLYPNPTRAEVSITFENEQEEFTVSIYTVSGELIEQKQFFDSSQVDLAIKGSPGAYLLRINSKDQEATIRVVKE